ncbi:hypothetical protein PHYBLDRAFT_159242 [Phycomyces blakesleeanus NRRL 1555(-)]|uniref:Uncharacterized protein n=2 Tax=Phycomyces blakesleeanus TaxID=4837 RepID=A0A163DLB4_PHYB8|nr:hypothetical protein PHYBLDRAFT_159242 [Phycomyces blakesleeanus NRRL 1555(-)]OAD72100.1 hypothetical protein PHYBLDRAFT_159242 [Phycomyces blakesleeanus NRRL 1555(-)]|eukprot:XP_018290140.1 hypothetical protein PHYBLDRAFT_159242 [Phycomyces blakesleeanus NRRL 1555(-)]
MDDCEILKSGNVEVKIDFIRRLYLTVLGMDTLFPLPFKRSFNPKEFRRSTFAWINLIFLTSIARWIYDKPSLDDTLTLQISMAYDLGLKSVESEDSKSLMFKYTSDCVRL